MNKKSFTKTLTANDTGESGAHQAGIHIPKGEKELIAFLPKLDSVKKNPDAWICCRDEFGKDWDFRYIYYNNKLHDAGGTRNEYRLTHMTKYFREAGVKEGDEFEITGVTGCSKYEIRVVKSRTLEDPVQTGPIRLKGWRRVH